MKYSNRNEQHQPQNEKILTDTVKRYDTGPNSVVGEVKNYDDNFLKAHATKPDDVIFEELLYYVNYKKQRGDFISYDEKIQIDRYCNLLLKQLKVNRLWREEKGIENLGGFNNIPEEFYQLVEDEKLPMVNFYYKEPSINSFATVSIRIPSDKIDEFKKLKIENPDKNYNEKATLKSSNSNGANNVLFTIDVETHENQRREDAKYDGLSEKEIKKLKKKEAKEAKKKAKNGINNVSSSTPPPNIPGRPSVPGSTPSSGAPNIPGRPSVPGSTPNAAPSIPGKPGVPPTKPKGPFDL